MQQICSSFRINIVSGPDAGVGRIGSYILPESNIEDILDSESIVGFEVDFPRLEVVLDELEEGINFKGQSFLYGGSCTCDLERRISSRDSPVP